MKALIAKLTKGFTVNTKAADYQPIKAGKNVIGEIQIRKNGTLSLRLKAALPASAPAAVKKAFVKTKSSKWSLLMADVNEGNVKAARMALELAAAATAEPAPKKSVAPSTIVDDTKADLAKAVAKRTTRAKTAA